MDSMPTALAEPLTTLPVHNSVWEVLANFVCVTDFAAFYKSQQHPSLSWFIKWEYSDSLPSAPYVLSGHLEGLDHWICKHGQ